MAKIKLVGISEFAKRKGINRTTAWRLLKKDELDYFVVPGSKRKWMRAKEPNFKEKEKRALEQILNYDVI